MKILWSLLLLLSSYAFAGEKLQLPPRPAHALPGKAFMKKITPLSPAKREQAILKEILRGNVPDFLRNLRPMETRISSGPHAGQLLRYWILPDYLAIGSDSDFVRVPLNLHSIAKLNERLNSSLPTVKMVNEIYARANLKLSPQPIACKGNKITAVSTILEHDQILHDPRYRPGELIAGHKKDIVQTRRLLKKPGAIAIYGWHRQNREPIQPLSTVHSADYADYSHGVRLVANKVELNGRSYDLRDLLESKRYASLLSNEGSIPQERTVKGRTLASIASHP